MLRNYFKIAFRNLSKQKLYSGINILGLSLGIACALIIGMWVQDEVSYNQFMSDADNVYLVRVNYGLANGEIVTGPATPSPLQEVIAQDILQVKAVTKITYEPEQLLVKVGETSAKEKGYYASADFFKVFLLPTITGDPKTALMNPNQIVITRKMAKKYFALGQAIGKKLQLDNQKFYTIGAVIDDLPTTSTLTFDWVVNFSNIEQPWMKSWGNTMFKTFVRLQPNTTATEAEASMKNLFRRYTKDEDDAGWPVLQSITDVYLYGEYKNGKGVAGRIEYVRIFSLVALFILLVACINFINLTTARSALRAKEVGVRKVVGALRSSIIGQFLSESILISVLAAIVALGFVWTVLPTFNSVFDKQLSINLTDKNLWLMLGSVVLITGLVSGSYPALFLSGLRPVRILKGHLQSGVGPAYFRRILVVFQFALSIFLIVGMLVVGRQMNYLKTTNLGINRENVLYVPLEGEIAQSTKVEAFRDEVMRQRGVASVTMTSSLPVDIQGTSGDLDWQGREPKQPSNVAAMQVGGDFIRTMNIQLIEGRDFRTNSQVDSNSYIINEAAAKMMNMESPVGKEVKFWQGKGPIIGLMKDFHINSLHQQIMPLVLCFNPAGTNYLLIKTHAGQTEQVIAELEKLTKQFNPNYPFTYHFVDEAYGNLYKAEQQVNILVNYFGMLAIFISCLGLFALAAFTAEQRKKEISVRKVLGASVSSIVAMLSTDFLRLIVIALIIITPLAWWAVSEWLDTFAYKTTLSWWIFVVAGSLAIGIALMTVSYQSIKAALMNPVKSLKNE
ncbi:ABC transporter permease [Emticicia sp. BO119]|nr:ABC transporter permease [Emticicia sp. BO119]